MGKLLTVFDVLAQFRHGDIPVQVNLLTNEGCILLPYPSWGGKGERWKKLMDSLVYGFELETEHLDDGEPFLLLTMHLDDI